jgi:hypothetical protein
MQLRQTGVTWQVVGDEVVVLDLDGSVYLKVNGSGRVLWEALNGSASEPHLVSLLADRYEIDASQAAADVTAFLSELRTRKLLID